MPRLSELRVDYALSPMWATPAEPRAMRINWPTRNKPTRRRVGSGDDTIDDTIVASTYQAIRCSRNMPGGKSNDFVRYDSESSLKVCFNLQTIHSHDMRDWLERANQRSGPWLTIIGFLESGTLATVGVNYLECMTVIGLFCTHAKISLCCISKPSASEYN